MNLPDVKDRVKSGACSRVNICAGFRHSRFPVTPSSRRGQVVFLEFVCTLPIFALLLYTATTFHWWYTHTRENYGAAHLVVQREVDHHWSEDDNHIQIDDRVVAKMKPDGTVGGRPAIFDEVDTLANLAPAVNNDILVRRYGSLSFRTIRVPLWRDEATATGVAFSTRDSWSHRDIRDKLVTPRQQRAPARSHDEVQNYKGMPFTLLEDNVGQGDEGKRFLQI